MAKNGGGQRGWRGFNGQRRKDVAGSPGRSPGERLPEGCWTKDELDGDLVGPGARDGSKADAWRKGGRAEGLIDLAAWIDGDRLEFIKMSGGEDETCFPREGHRDRWR